MGWNGGNRNVPVRHNIIGLLTEAASAHLATPVLLSPAELRAPSGPGGWWRIADIIEYELVFGRSLRARPLTRRASTQYGTRSDFASHARNASRASSPSSVSVRSARSAGGLASSSYSRAWSNPAAAASSRVAA